MAEIKVGDTLHRATVQRTEDGIPTVVLTTHKVLRLTPKGVYITTKSGKGSAYMPIVENPWAHQTVKQAREALALAQQRRIAVLQKQINECTYIWGLAIDTLGEYRKLMNELLFLRESEGGALPTEVESSYVERLDKLWHQLSEAEQEQYETEGKEAPKTLGLVDRVVAIGDMVVPRDTVKLKRVFNRLEQASNTKTIAHAYAIGTDAQEEIPTAPKESDCASCARRVGDWCEEGLTPPKENTCSEYTTNLNGLE